MCLCGGGDKYWRRRWNDAMKAEGCMRKEHLLHNFNCRVKRTNERINERTNERLLLRRLSRICSEKTLIIKIAIITTRTTSTTHRHEQHQHTKNNNANMHTHSLKRTQSQRVYRTDGIIPG